MLYDWAYSPFNTIVTTFVFATYFVQAVAPDPASGTASWAAMQASAGLLIALFATPIGAIADASDARHVMLVLFTMLMAACTAALWFVYPSQAYATRALLLARTEPIELPEAWGVMARRWRTPVLASDCPSSLPPAAPGAPHAR
jgi:UMF1 family MFS transporter